MLPQVTVLQASETEKERVFELHSEMFRDEIEERWGWDDQWQRNNFNEEWKRDAFAVVKREDQIIGYTQITVEQNKIQIASIGLLPDFRKQGLGSLLLEGILREARKLNLPVELSVHLKNQSALKLYRKFKFETIESQGKSILMRWTQKSNKTVLSTPVAAPLPR